MFGAGMIPTHDIEGAISEARRAVNELGFKTVFVRPNPVNGRNWHDAYYDPLWAEIERLGVPLSFHEGGCACRNRATTSILTCSTTPAPTLWG